MKKRTRRWLAPDGTRYKGEWSHPSVLFLMGILPPELYKRAHKPRLDLEELAALRHFRGTGQYVGKDAQQKDRLRGAHEWNACMSLRARGLLEHSIADRWYLTDRGRELLRKGVTATTIIKEMK